ncbi:MAG: Phenylacetaldehyde dehydrogenase [Verrucomicrobia subdivision 3 bacterium]|nr:Phenylacetaldehyde dehydrogenase [Limisphaerales bacterium]MCS1415190.1 Phenylacetaldehyde dehydrogenase [Limisphaerales bacterium]
MATASIDIQAFTATTFTTPDKFSQFCSNGGAPLGGIIGGKSVSGSMNATFQTTDPGSQEVLATICEMGEAEVALAVETAHKAFIGDNGNGWKDVLVEKRIALVNKLVELCGRDRDILLACEIRDGGKVSELATGDFTQIRECAEYFSGVARRIAMGEGPERSVAPRVKGFTYREPWGVVAGIIPWNYPIVLTSWFMFPALLAGNTVLIKPAEDTPISALYIAKLAAEAGFPPGVINVLPGRGEITGQCIAKHPGVRYISFTGSPGVGQAILRTCDRHGTRMKREMGGNGSAIVLSDADPELVARMVGRYVNQHYGQTCCTVHRVFVDRKIADPFIDAQRSFLEGLKIGYQTDEGTQLGSVINSTQHHRILQAQKETAARGGQAILSGGVAEVSGKDGFYLKPALYRTSPEVDCNPQEVFHTFATVCPVDSAEEALQLANRSPYGLGASVWTQDIERGVALAKKFRDGTGQVNCHNSIAYGLPYGGQGISGGPGGGVNCEDTFLDYTQVKAVYVADYPG